MSATTAPRQIPARVLTRDGWISGSFQMPTMGSFLDCLDRAGAFVRMTDVAFGEQRWNGPFAIRHEAICVVIPECDEKELNLQPPRQATARHDVTCVFGTYALRGSLGMIPNIDVVDFLLQHQGLSTLRAATSSTGEEVRLAVFNARALMGVIAHD